MNTPIKDKRRLSQMLRGIQTFSEKKRTRKRCTNLLNGENWDYLYEFVQQMSTTKHCLIYSIHSSYHRQSAIIFDGKYILAPGIIVKGIFTNEQYDSGVRKKLDNFQIVDISKDQQFQSVSTYVFTIIHKNSNDNKSEILQKSEATILYIFNCQNIATVLKHTLNGFKLNTNENNQLNPEDYLSSCFVILKISSYNNESGENSIDNNNPTADIDITIHNDNVNKLEKVYSETTPFGNESFFGTINFGNVANVLPPNDCLMIVSMPLVNGCEGGALYNDKGNLIGVIICTTFTWRSENANLTLVASVFEIFRNFLCQMEIINFKKFSQNFERQPELGNSIEQSVVLIGNKESWGTGCFLKINNFKMIITCSHVVINQDEVKCIWKDRHFISKIIYRNPKFNEPYDVAILSVPDCIPDEYFSTCYLKKPKVGKQIYAIGFPHFSSLATVHFSPGIYEGRITKCYPGMFLTDASIQAGQSGGPILTKTGKLIGISVSNSKSQRRLYPHLNMAVPVFEIYPILDKYIKTKELTELNRLVADKQIQSIWALEPQKVVSKL